uniref:Uncharacterized protein n=1 Tax=Arundo donax TaxID=35708 RepID=A0A0A9AC30_ARUDO
MGGGRGRSGFGDFYFYFLSSVLFLRV